jgi:hypothetical protein
MTMTSTTLKATIESLIASGALVVVTLDGTFNSKTGAPVLNSRTRPDQRNAFLRQFCEKVNPTEAKDAQTALQQSIKDAEDAAFIALAAKDYPAVIKATQNVIALTDQLDQPRMYYRVKEAVDLRTVAEKRAARKAENEQKRVAAKAAKETKAAEKMAAKVQADQPHPQPEPVSQIAEPKGAKNKKAA